MLIHLMNYLGVNTSQLKWHHDIFESLLSYYITRRRFRMFQWWVFRNTVQKRVRPFFLFFAHRLVIFRTINYFLASYLFEALARRWCKIYPRISLPFYELPKLKTFFSLIFFLGCIYSSGSDRSALAFKHTF